MTHVLHAFDFVQHFFSSGQHNLVFITIFFFFFFLICPVKCGAVVHCIFIFHWCDILFIRLFFFLAFSVRATHTLSPIQFRSSPFFTLSDSLYIILLTTILFWLVFYLFRLPVAICVCFILFRFLIWFFFFFFRADFLVP